MSICKGLYAITFAKLYIKPLNAFGMTIHKVCPDPMLNQSRTPQPNILLIFFVVLRVSSEGVAAIAVNPFGFERAVRCALAHSVDGDVLMVGE